MNQPGLRLRDLHAWYGASHVLQGIDLEVERAQIVALLGRNGSGRSTLAKAVVGLVDHAGSVSVHGTELSALATHRRARAGLGYVPETRDIFPVLTVAENLALGRQTGTPGRWREQDMYDLFPALAARADTPGHALSGGEQQMLALCRTLMGDPSVIIVDEPTEGLAPMVVDQLARFFVTLRAAGVSVLLIEQRLDIALQISDRVYVLGHGKIVFHGSADQLRHDAPTRQRWLEI